MIAISERQIFQGVEHALNVYHIQDLSRVNCRDKIFITRVLENVIKRAFGELNNVF